MILILMTYTQIAHMSRTIFRIYETESNRKKLISTSHFNFIEFLFNVLTFWEFRRKFKTTLAAISKPRLAKYSKPKI